MNKTELDLISGEIVDAAMKIHMRLGPGMVESVYEVILARDLTVRGLTLERQKLISPTIDGILFEEAFRIDMLVNGVVLVEIKSRENLTFLHERQLITYLKVMDVRLGLLLNFGSALMKDGIRRVVNQI